MRTKTHLALMKHLGGVADKCRDDTSIRDPKDITPETGHLLMIEPIKNLETKYTR